METREGRLAAFEINPRVSTTLVLAVAAGADPVADFLATGGNGARWSRLRAACVCVASGSTSSSLPQLGESDTGSWRHPVCRAPDGGQLVAAGHDVTVLSVAKTRCRERSTSSLSARPGSRSSRARKVERACSMFIRRGERARGSASARRHPDRRLSALPRLNASAADALVPADDSRASERCSRSRARYLLGKARIEPHHAAAGMRAPRLLVVRLPIMLGWGRSIGRLDFLIARGSPGGQGVLDGRRRREPAQVLWRDDAAPALDGARGGSNGRRGRIWEGSAGRRSSRVGTGSYVGCRSATMGLHQTSCCRCQPACCLPALNWLTRREPLALTWDAVADAAFGNLFTSSARNVASRCAEYASAHAGGQAHPRA